MDTLFIPLLERLASTISAAGVRYMVIGGQAVIQYGESRLTEDVDITIGIDAGDWRRADGLLRTADLIPRTANYEMLAEANIERTYCAPTAHLLQTPDQPHAGSHRRHKGQRVGTERA